MPEPSAPGRRPPGVTSQAERLPTDLLPQHLQLDAQTLPELLAYVARFSEKIQFYTDPAGPAASTWALAWHRGLLLLALFAARPSGEPAAAITLRPLHDPAAAPAQQQLLHEQARTLHEWHAAWLAGAQLPELAEALASVVARVAPAVLPARPAAGGAVFPPVIILQLANTIVTLDARGCQQAIARQLLAQQADYILALKGNQGRSQRAVKAYCHTCYVDRWLYYPTDYDAFDRRHGRWVRRRAWLLPVGEQLAGLRAWPGLRAIIVVETIRSVQYQLGTRAEWRYYLTSCPDAPAMLIQTIRRHWAIENSLHWVLDVVFREDEARSRDRVATRNFAVLRKLAFNLLQQGKHQPGSLRTRRRNAGWNDNYLTQLLTCARENCQVTMTSSHLLGRSKVAHQAC